MEKEEKIDQDIYQKYLENDFLNQLERQKSIFHKVVEENARLKRKINQFEKELAKDEEVKTLKEQVARMQQESLNGFTISKRVSNKFEKFKESHLREKHCRGSRRQIFVYICPNRDRNTHYMYMCMW